MHDINATRTPFWRPWLIWMLGFLALPIGGFAAILVVGRIDSAPAAVIGGAITGLVVGAGQALASRGRLDWRWWVPATTVGMAVGLLLGAAAVGYRSTLPDLVIMGALTGVPLGIAQTIALPRRALLRWIWAVAMPALWALGWTVTTVAGIAVSDQFPIFGAFGAIAFTAASGVLLHVLLPTGPAPAGQSQSDTAHPVVADVQ